MYFIFGSPLLDLDLWDPRIEFLCWPSEGFCLPAAELGRCEQPCSAEPRGAAAGGLSGLECFSKSGLAVAGPLESGSASAHGVLRVLVHLHSQAACC